MRYPLVIPLRLRGGQGQAYSAQSSDVAVAALGVTTSREAVLALAQGGTVLTSGDSLEVMLPAPGEHDEPAAVLPGRVRHVRRVSQDRYHLGVGLERLTAEDEALVSAWVERARAASPF